MVVIAYVDESATTRVEVRPNGPLLGAPMSKVTIVPFLDGSTPPFSFHRLEGIEPGQVEEILSTLFDTSVSSIKSIPISTDGSSLLFRPNPSILAEYVSEDMTLWYLPLSLSYDPSSLMHLLIPTKVKAKTLVIHSSGSLDLVPHLKQGRCIRHCWTGTTDGMVEFLRKLTLMYQEVVPRLVKCNVTSIRPAYNDLGEWLADEDNLYIGGVKPVFSKEKVDGRRVKFLKDDSVYFRGPLEREGDFRARIRSLTRPHPSGTEGRTYGFYEHVSGKNLGCWCEPRDCHGSLIVDEFRVEFVRRTFRM